MEPKPTSQPELEPEEGEAEESVGADPADPWDYSSREYELIRTALLPLYPIVPLLQAHERDLRPTGGGTWSHKCCCPSYQHKQGSERTPSFCVNEQTGQFLCFGCSWYGDSLTLLAMWAGTPEEDLISGVWRSGGHSLEMGQRIPKPDVIKLNHRLSCVLRDYLKGFWGSGQYESERVWVDYTFGMIDEKLDRMERGDAQAGTRMYEQVLMDLERRKLERGV